MSELLLLWLISPPRLSFAQADSISDGDLVSRSIMSQQLFTLMPFHAVVSTVTPGFHFSGGGARPQFPRSFLFSVLCFVS